MVMMLDSTGQTNDSPDNASAMRIMDANANRASEGLRVVEDYLRFHRQDAFLSRTCKQIRHDMSQTLAGMDVEARLLSRSPQSDVGATIQTDSEYHRATIDAVAAANLRRAAEALRTLEECAKLCNETECAKAFESIRYATYSLEKAVFHSLRAGQLLEAAQLYVLVDLSFDIGIEFERRVGSLIEARVDVLQLRAKNSNDREVVAAARMLRSLTTGTDTTFIVNDRADIAKVVQADGVHVGQDELTVTEVRSILGPDRLVGVSTHSIEQARQAVLDGADYIGVGPVFESTTKTFDQFVGVELVEEVLLDIGIPVFPIGGITHARVESLRAVGASRIAVSSAVWHASNPEVAVAQLRTALA